MQSLLVTCRQRDVNPYNYFVDVLQRVGQHPTSMVHQLTQRIWKQMAVAHFGGGAWTGHLSAAALDGHTTLVNAKVHTIPQDGNIKSSYNNDFVANIDCYTHSLCHQHYLHMSNLDLSPAWKPLPLAGISAPYPVKAFDSTVVDSLGLVVAGGPASLSVFEVFQRQRRWFSIPSRLGFAGYGVGEGVLYVQDGPVLCAWSLTQSSVVDGQDQPVCIGAINLLSQQVAGITGDGPSASQLDAVFQVDTAYTARKANVDAAGNALGWVELLDTVEWMQAIWTSGSAGPAQLTPDCLASLRSYIRSILGDRADTATPASLRANARLGLLAAQAANAPCAWSTPVVRQHQIGSAVGGDVFVLGADGSLYACDGPLTNLRVARFDVPADLQLAMLEQPAEHDPSSFVCKLSYLNQQSAVVQLDAADNPLSLAGNWPAAGAASAPLPLSYQDGMLWSGGILGSDFSARTPAPASATTLSVNNNGVSWQSYAVAPAQHLALVSDGSVARLNSYAADARVHDRWQAAPLPGWMTLWQTGTGQGGDPLIVLSGQWRAGLRQVDINYTSTVANTVDAPNPQLASDYPPAPVQLVSGALTPGSFRDNLRRIGCLRSKPIVDQQTAFAVAQPMSPFDAVINFLTPDLSRPDGMSPFAVFSSAKPPAPSAASPSLPSLMTDPDMLVAFLLNPLATVAVPAANAQLQRMEDLVAGITLQVTVDLIVEDKTNPFTINDCKQPIQFPLLVDQANRPFYVQCPVNGTIVLDSCFDGRDACIASINSRMTVTMYDPMGNVDPTIWVDWTSTTVQLKAGQPLPMTVTLTIRNPD